MLWFVFACLSLLLLSRASNIASEVHKFNSLKHCRNITVVILLFFGGWLANNTWYNYTTFTNHIEANFSLYQDYENPNHFVFEGEISEGVGSFVIRGILNSENLDMNVPISLEMHSEGGKPSEAIILGEFIKQYDVAVEVLGNCISACSTYFTK